MLEDQQGGGDGLQEARHRVGELRVDRPGEPLADGVAHARHVEQALAQQGLGDVLQFVVDLVLRLLSRPLRLLDHQPHQALVEPVLDAQQRGGDRQQFFLRLGAIAIEQAVQAAGLGLHLVAHVAEPQHAERVADLGEQLQLGIEALGRHLAGTRKQVERVLDLAEILADRTGHGAHQLHARSAEAVARLGQVVLVRQQVAKAERAADGVDAAAAGGRARHVEQQAVQQLNRRRGGEPRLTLVHQAADLPVHLAEQALDRGAGREPALAQPLDHAAEHPPQLVYGRLGGRAFKRRGHVGDHRKTAVGPFPADPVEQRRLVARPQLFRQHDDVLAGGLRPRAARQQLAVGRQVQQQQRVLGQQRRAACRPQVVQQGQQHQRDVAPAGDHPIEIGRQLDDGARQGVEAFLGRLAGGDVAMQVQRELLHLVGQQRGAIDLGDAQRAVRRVQ